jgi:hypothetical protein
MSETRLTICNECEHLRKSVMQCNKCGCFMTAKVRFPSSSCPIGKWEREEEINT